MSTTSTTTTATNETPKAVPTKDNGGKGKNHTWSQTLREVTVTIPVCPGARARDLKVEIKPNHLTVKYANGETLVDGELYKRVVVDDCCWQMEDTKEGKNVVVYLLKHNTMEWWSCVLKGEEEIDLTKVEPENANIKDLDPETRAQVEKMMYDQRQKELGLPTSEDRQKQALINKIIEKNPEWKDKFNS